MFDKVNLMLISLLPYSESIGYALLLFAIFAVSL